MASQSNERAASCPARGGEWFMQSTALQRDARGRPHRDRGACFKPVLLNGQHTLQEGVVASFPQGLRGAGGPPKALSQPFAMGEASLCDAPGLLNGIAASRPLPSGPSLACDVMQSDAAAEQCPPCERWIAWQCWHHWLQGRALHVMHLLFTLLAAY